jgi:hypothetical protein
MPSKGNDCHGGTGSGLLRGGRQAEQKKGVLNQAIHLALFVPAVGGGA